MTLITLQRTAPVAPNATTCRLCDVPIVGQTQDDLLIGQPGTAEVKAVICQRCGDAVVRLVDVCGSNNLSVLIKGETAPKESTGRKPSELEQTRHRLAREAETLGQTAQTLRGEAEKLSHVQRRK
jgi:hypothetical protein